MPAPLPQSICDRVKILRTVHTKKAVAEIVRIDKQTVGSIERRGYKRAVGKARRPMPFDYVIQCSRLTRDELCAHYSAGSATVNRWNKEIGRKPLVGVQPHKHAIPSRAVIEAAISKRGLKLAHEEFSTSRVTFFKWRKMLGIPMRGHEAKPQRSGIDWGYRYYQKPPQAGGTL